MTVALILLAALIIAGALLWLWEKVHGHDDEPQPQDEAATDADNDDCCGMHITCERDSLLSAVSEKIEYYDDEELDRYAGIAAEYYTPSESEEFREILLSMPPDNIAGWVRSLGLRGINLPNDVRDEIIMIVAEERSRRTSKH